EGGSLQSYHALLLARSATSGLVKHQRAQFDALAQRRVGRCGGIDEGGVRPEPRAAVVQRVIALQKESFLRLHLRKIEPAMVGIEFDRIGLAAAVGIDQVGGDEIAGRDRRAIAHGKRRIMDGAADRSPEIDDLHTTLQELLRLVGKMLANAVWTRRQ